MTNKILVGIVLILTLAGCSTTPQLHSSLQFRNTGLQAGQLRAHGLAFITPATATGKEEDRQILALTFSQELLKDLPKVRCVSLPETLGAINRAGLTAEYKQMYQDYRQTGIFPHEIVSRVGQAAGARYLAQLNLADFSRNSQGRFGVAGLRVMQTKGTDIRLLLQIWDSEEGAIVWEGVQELNYSYDTITEEPVTFNTVVAEAARRLIARLPGAPPELLEGAGK